MQTIVDIIKGLAAREPARIAAYGGGLLLAAALYLANAAGVTLSPEITTGIQALGVLVVTEVIRRAVFSPAAVQRIAEAPLDTPPTGDLPVAEAPPAP